MQHTPTNTNCELWQWELMERNPARGIFGPIDSGTFDEKDPEAAKAIIAARLPFVPGEWETTESKLWDIRLTKGDDEIKIYLKTGKVSVKEYRRRQRERIARQHPVTDPIDLNELNQLLAELTGKA